VNAAVGRWLRINNTGRCVQNPRVSVQLIDGEHKALISASHLLHSGDLLATSDCCCTFIGLIGGLAAEVANESEDLQLFVGGPALTVP
jgi:hypothetical protein